jgi:hypothetical protein
MKKRCVFLFALLLCASLPSVAVNIYKHQILQSEVDELNKLGDALGISETGWPVSGEEFDNYPTISGVGLLNFKTVFKELISNPDDPEKPDSVFIHQYKVKSISFSNKSFSGTLPDLSFDEIKTFYFHRCNLEGNLPSFNFPLCTKIVLSSNNLTGEIPDFDLPALEELNLTSNSFSGQLRLFTGMPTLKILSVRSNQLTGIDQNFGMPSLETFYANDNNYSGTFPSFNCPKLKSLYLSYENFSGDIPTDMILPSLTSLEIRNNGFSGSLPDLNLPSLTYLDVTNNKLSGEIPAFNGMPVLETANLGLNEFTSIASGFHHPTLKTLYIWDCKLTGNLPSISLPQGDILHLSGNKLTGNIPDLNCPNLTFLSLAVNEFTGSIPNFNMPKMENLQLHENKLTGSIPNFNMPALRYLDLQHNELTGNIPEFNFPELRELELRSNKLEGTLPNFNCPNLEELDVTDNNLSGSIPDFSLPNLQYLELSNNHFSEQLPAFQLPALINLIVANNKLSGPLPDMHLPSVQGINLEGNQFSGEMPQWNFPELRTLRLSNNKLEGEFNNQGLTGLSTCLINNNEISGLTHLKTNSPGLYYVTAHVNKLTFEDLEPNMDISFFEYSNQDSVEHLATIKGSELVLTIKVGGTSNKYQWAKKRNNGSWEDIPGAASDSVNVPLENNTKYTCRVTNTMVPNLTLYSVEGKAPSCITLKNLQMCAEDSPWEEKDENELGTTGKVTINDLLIFEGTITIDTVKLSVKAEGEFYVNDIPLPGGSTGRYSFCNGEYELALLGEEGAITSFLDSNFEKLGQLFGIDLKLSKIELIGGRSATGIKIDCMVGIPGISGSCDNIDSKTEIELEGLTFSSSGISLDGIEVTDLGLLIDGYCLKQLVFNYDSEKDILISGAQVALPFGEIGGGFKLAQGYLDSIAWNLEATKPPFVLGTTTIGIKGFFGHISSITEPAIEVELGGIFSDITSDNFYRVTASGKTIWPSFFEVKGEGEFLKPPFIDKPYQVKGGVAMSYDHPLEMFAIDFLEGGIGTNDGETWLVSGNGKLKLSTRFDPPVLAGEVNGLMTLPEFDNKFPYDWLNSMFSFPVEAESNATFIWGKMHTLHGSARFQSGSYGPYSLRYVIDLSKSYGEDDFLWFETKIETKSARLKSGSTSNTLAEDVVIPENTDFAVIGIMSEATAPASVLINPSGKNFTESSKADNVQYSVSEDGKKAFWTLFEPVGGIWEVQLQNPAETDSILLFVQQKLPELEISLQQEGKNITITWDPTSFTSADSIAIMLDDNNSGFDGFAVAEGAAQTGTISFEMSDELSACSYFVFAQIAGDTQVVQAYAGSMANNPKAILAAPEILSVNYSKSTGKTTIWYEDSDDSNVAGYIVEVTDETGSDSTYAILNPGGSSVTLHIEKHENKTVKMTSFNTNGLKGCPTANQDIVTTVSEIPAEVSPAQNLLFYPNPTTGIGTIEFTLSESTSCELLITDIFGRIIAHPVSEYRMAGQYNEEWNFGNAPDGMYLVILRSRQGVQSEKIILSR